MIFSCSCLWVHHQCLQPCCILEHGLHGLIGCCVFTEMRCLHTVQRGVVVILQRQIYKWGTRHQYSASKQVALALLNCWHAALQQRWQRWFGHVLKDSSELHGDRRGSTYFLSGPYCPWSRDISMSPHYPRRSVRLSSWHAVTCAELAMHNNLATVN